MTNQNDPQLNALLKLIDNSSTELEDALREKLNTRYLQRQFRHLAHGDLARDASQAFGHFVERLSSGNIDEDFHKASAGLMKRVAKNVELVSEIFSESESEPNPSPKDPVTSLEETYIEMQGCLIQVRQAVAQAIATEKQLEQQIQRNKEQVATWENRAKMAVQQGSEELADQARQRKYHHEKSVTELEAVFRDQREATGRLRSRLTDLECKVQKAYTHVQLAKSRTRAEQAASVIDGLFEDAFDSMMQRADERMNEHIKSWKEATSAGTTSDHVETETAEQSREVSGDADNKQLLVRVTAALEASVAMIERLERFVSERESPNPSE